MTCLKLLVIILLQIDLERTFAQYYLFRYPLCQFQAENDVTKRIWLPAKIISRSKICPHRGCMVFITAVISKQRTESNMPITRLSASTLLKKKRRDTHIFESLDY